MSLAEKEGVLDLVSDKGILLSGDRLSYSKWFEGDRPTQDSVGCKVRVLLDVGDKVSFLKRILAISEKSVGWKPPEPGKAGVFGGGGGRRFSPEELTLKREEGVRIARSVAVDRAISLLKEGIAVEKIAPLAQAIEGYLLSGKFPEAGKGKEQDRPSPMPKALPPKEPAPSPSDSKGAASASPEDAKARSSSAVSRTKRPDPKAVNALFNDAKRAGILAEWSTYIALCRSLLRNNVESPYALSAAQFAQVESDLRTRFSRGAAA